MKRLLPIALFLLFSLVCAQAQTSDDVFNQAQQAYLNQDYEKAFKLYKQSADAGNPEAMHNVAVMLIQPVGCVQNVKRAIDYYVKASQAGYNPLNLQSRAHELHGQPQRKGKQTRGSQVLSDGGRQRAPRVGTLSGVDV